MRRSGVAGRAVFWSQCKVSLRRGKPETVDGLGTNEKVDDAEMRDGTERTAAADAAAKEEAIKVAAEAASREEELRQEGLRAEMEARRRA